MKDEGANAIVIVDDNQHVLASLVRFVARGGFAAAAFGSLGAALEMVSTSTISPAAAIIDVYLERGRQGFELGELLRRRFGNVIPIVMITGYTLTEVNHPYWCPEKNTEYTRSFNALDERIPVYAKPVRADALNAFLVRSAVTCQLREAPASFREAVVAYALRQQLTPQETRVLARLACGSTRASLPDDLGLSKDTVKSQIRNILARCNVGATDELIAALLRHISGAEGASLPASV